MTSTPAFDPDGSEPTRQDDRQGTVMRVSVLTIAVALLASTPAPGTASSAPAPTAWPVTAAPGRLRRRPGNRR